MGPLRYWLLAAVVFGILSGSLYTWMSPRRKGWARLWAVSSTVYTLIGLAVVWLLFKFL